MPHSFSNTFRTSLQGRRCVIHFSIVGVLKRHKFVVFVIYLFFLHPKRVLLFRELVRADKSALGILGQTNCMLDSSAVGAVIMIHRNRIVEVTVIPLSPRRCGELFSRRDCFIFRMDINNWLTLHLHNYA